MSRQANPKVCMMLGESVSSFTHAEVEAFWAVHGKVLKRVYT